MQLFVILRRSADVFIMGMISGDLVDQEMALQIFCKVTELTDININQYRPLRKFVEDCIGEPHRESFINKVKEFARAKQIWVHNKSTLV